MASAATSAANTGVVVKTSSCSSSSSSAANTNSSSNKINNCMLAGLVCRDNIHLIIGTNPLAASRCNQSLAAGAIPILIAPETADLHYGLQAKIDDKSLRWEKKAFEDDDLFRLGRQDVGRVVDAVFVTGGPRDPLSEHISSLCRRNRIPVNVVDAPHLCTFTLLSVHADGPLQVGVTTNGRGCKLASRIRREIASSLPPGLGPACARLGEVRRRIQDDDCLALGDLDDSLDQGALFNRLVAEEDVRNRRMRWLSQVCEYWPLRKLASIADDDVDRLFAAYNGPSRKPRHHDNGPAQQQQPRVGRLILAGSGPGHPSLLTRSTLDAIHRADLVLADKLVPAPVLELIPRRTPVHIARKFPGNAERAQEELLEAALQGVRDGKTVLRLKQGDPFVYGRGGEEVDWFKGKGLGDRVRVLPGMTSALSAPLFAGVPVTQRDVADQVLICTGTGKKGKPPTPPEYVASRTVVFLMALHRIVGLVRELTSHIPASSADSGADTTTTTTTESPSPEAAALAAATAADDDDDKKRALWPLSTPCAVIERASCPDQRIIRTTLAHVAEAIESEGSRPPGLLVVGRACDVLHPREKGRAWLVEEGFRGLDDDDDDSSSSVAEWAAGLAAVTDVRETIPA
ncbi:Uroporphyrinogen-III C-methyltransferase [Purpureocillium takamizusanense]|uniref:precorrin-2 dehydrogenase n=1 Tax=Purpureocillium takamizusanense TaxID=2060973 RepID=A0A9Q8Q6A0_9HYPO|nr:Uroporphyrinogen-III C-methyltransferase [Purpureocillium takamizusanense]UNI13780.1 Uroporphyrinogen-III C-methyltransferase [Purpureocillium takamizusanense]